ncbi:MAG: SDR family oxidoreductase [Deltaproteobacteria bacterium]|nr:SDR family oxidoreductase [Deltaproteobacteria bacterium]MBI3386856.1 SDR family oxidoreductase [Deltaproteobacteria bacterium]
MRLANQVAIVTGAGQGIGRAIALAYAREGARVLVAELKPHRVERTVGEIAAAGGVAAGVEVDTGVRAQVEHMIAAARRHFGQLDILVHNAQSYAPHTPLENVTDEQFDGVFTSGAKGALWAMQAAFPLLRERGGRIINIVSLAAERGDPGLGPYNATKMAMLALTRTAAREWGKYNILVNAIAPAALTRRGQDYAARDPERFAQIMAERPIGRLGDPGEDIAPVAVFLASADARYLTGHTFYADGGAHISSV